MRSLVAGTQSPTEENPEEASTVGIELFPHLPQGTKIEFYDCAGQVDYAGMHQAFLTQRALYLLVSDVRLFYNHDEININEVGAWRVRRGAMTAGVLTHVVRSKTVPKYYQGIYSPLS